jgi:HTH-type transcriptional regulator/antitoxin HigA
MAVNMLQAIGVAVIIEPHLPGTFLDGATLMMDEEFPVIGMTIRHDRVDNFWFTLIHELAHLFLHLGGQYDSFVDDLDFEDKLDSCEREADDLASEILIPSQEWTKSPASKLNSEDAALHLARKLGIHPAIIAGRMRHELKNYRILSQLVGYGEVRKLFPKVAWDLKDVEQH